MRMGSTSALARQRLLLQSRRILSSPAVTRRWFRRRRNADRYRFATALQLAATSLMPLLLAGARIAGLLLGGEAREVSLCDYVPNAGLLITSIILPGDGFGPVSAFVKLGPRHDLTIARLNLAATAWRAEDRLVGLRIMAGALAPRPIALHRAAKALDGQTLSSDTLCAFLDALSAEVDTTIAGRGSQAWKRQAIRGVGIDLIARLLALDCRSPLFDEVW